MKQLRALWRRLTAPNDNPWLALLAALVGALILLGLLYFVAPLLTQ
ncbi:MAG: hypothetical protein HC875_35325 [Anaerolineales bacterium]|nr:hypothetical protein [Anaerolineales bacterium]